MKKPNRRNTAIDAHRMRTWTNEYANYRYTVSEQRIREWIEQFAPNHQDLAARLLDCIDFITHDQISAAYKSILKGLDGWNKYENRRHGEWRFAPYSASVGESGDSMLHKFRHANNLADKKYDRLFVHRSELLGQRLGPDDSVVLVDDFVGSGDQACESWANQFEELLAGVGCVYLVVVAACSTAIQRIANETDLELVPHIHLTESDNVLASRCKHFNMADKTALLQFCKKADRRKPRGHGDCGLLVVFAHSCPNNSIPVLHRAHRNWEAIFLRYD